MTVDTQIKHKKVHFYKYLYKKKKEQKKQKKNKYKKKTSFIHEDGSNCRMHACIFFSCSDDKLASRHSHRQNSTVLQT